jgi:hypothetical protein
MVIKDGRAYIQAGAGIVADSIPANEYHECLNKARALLRALDEAEQLASQHAQATEETNEQTASTTISTISTAAIPQ